MICLKCKHLDDLRKSPKHSAVGIGICNKEKDHGVYGVFVSFNYRRDCSGFDAADEKIAQTRITWYEGNRENK